MRSPRYHRILASTALALIFVAPLPGLAQDLEIRAAAQAAPAATTPAAAQSAPAEAASQAPAAATEPATPADLLASLDPADRPVAEKIRDLLATKADKLFAIKKDREAVVAFYQNRNLAPVWLDKGVVNARAASVIARMKAADTDGLEAADYKAPGFAGLTPDALAEADLKLTHVVLTYARHLQAGRFAYTRVSRNIELPQAAPEPADILGRIVDAADAGQALDQFSPQQEPYRKLKAMLAELRNRPDAAKGEGARQIEAVIVNMERWRWYPRDLGNAHVIVNEPDFTLKVMAGGTQVWTTRVVIGKPGTATPLLSETMKSITVNPTWHVPPSIVHNEYLPALAQDPTVLERMGLRVNYGSNGDVQITQPPGDGNALGRVRFNFPNRFSVYHHDTPDKQLFANEFRAYSHGCMRVQDPAKYAEVLLNIARPRERWTADRVKHMFGNAEQDLTLPAQIWVHLTYQTAFVDGAGKLQMRRDLYGLDSRTLAAIKSERGGAEPAVARKRGPEMASGAAPSKPSRPVVRPEPQQVYYGATGYAPNAMGYAPNTMGYAGPQMPRYFYR
jgi:murein L,D-transpeptidase YcbB/YkuD